MNRYLRLLFVSVVPTACSDDTPSDNPANLSDIPITEVPGNAASTPNATESATAARATTVSDDNPKPFVILFSGDGGWAPLVQQVSKHLADAGYPVVGISSQKYFWSEHDPAAMARDIERIIAHYSKKWNRKSFALAGFSFGADAVSFAVPQLHKNDLANLKALALLSPLRNADFEFHVSGWLHDGSKGNPIAPELAKLGK